MKIRYFETISYILKGKSIGNQIKMDLRWIRRMCKAGLLLKRVRKFIKLWTISIKSLIAEDFNANVDHFITMKALTLKGISGQIL